MGARQSLGLFVGPLKTATGLGIVAVSFALAIGQFVWGLTQPVFGAIADRHGSGVVLVAGALVLAVGAALTTVVSSELGLTLSLGILFAAGAAAGSFSILIGVTMRGLKPEKRAFAAGVINAGGSLGQFILAPISQFIITTAGWIIAMYALAAAALVTIPLTLPLLKSRARESVSAASPPSSSGSSQTLREQLHTALLDRSYRCLHAGFFTCGFHIAFLVTHLPGEVDLCGLPPTVASWSLALIGLANIVGSLIAGSSTARFRSKYILAVMYGSRALLIGWYLMAPKTEWTFYIFAVALGLTWLATVPPTAAIVGKLFGIRYLATLFGLTLLSHQIGGFLGAYLGGIALAQSGDYHWMWYADMTLAAAAAIVNLPIHEARIVEPVSVAA